MDSPWRSVQDALYRVGATQGVATVSSRGDEGVSGDLSIRIWVPVMSVFSFMLLRFV